MENDNRCALRRTALFKVNSMSALNIDFLRIEWLYHGIQRVEFVRSCC